MPVSTDTVVAPERPASVLLAATTRLPPPRSALTVAPSKVVVAADSVPLPSTVPASVALPIVSVPASCSVAPDARSSVLVSCRRSGADSASVPTATVVLPV